MLPHASKGWLWEEKEEKGAPFDGLGLWWHCPSQSRVHKLTITQNQFSVLSIQCPLNSVSSQFCVLSILCPLNSVSSQFSVLYCRAESPLCVSAHMM